MKGTIRVRLYFMRKIRIYTHEENDANPQNTATLYEQYPLDEKKLGIPN
jgi:hypothetical protein